MKRAGLLYCADVDAPRYKLLKQRDQLPFVTHEAGDGDKWADFNMDECFRLRLALDLIGNDGSKEYQHPGVIPGYAVDIVRDGLSKFEVSPLVSLAPNCWVAVAIFEAQEMGEDDKPLRFSCWFGGPLDQLSNWIVEQSTREEAAPVRILMANASRAAAFVRRRAAELGLPEADQFDKAE